MHPYEGLPPERFWREAVADHIWSDVDFLAEPKFKLEASDRIATAGSCFAQHIAKKLGHLGLTHFVTEQPPHVLSVRRRDELQYGVFSARYGNVYTARQLRQLIEFAFSLREPSGLYAQEKSGWFDLLRPGVQPHGYDTVHDLECDRTFHLDCVRRLFLEADCFVFTLGLTEAWYDAGCGSVFPVCPGTRFGKFDAHAHRFVNFTFQSVCEDLEWCIDFTGRRNPRLKWIFTVSPVALAATATKRHVLIANSASKSILRAVTDEVSARHPNCEYFPSYEICASSANFGQFLDSDLRGISPRGVQLVMRVFRRAFHANLASDSVQAEAAPDTGHVLSAKILAATAAECDEVFNDPKVAG